jgi:hypothetical protein
MELVENKPNAVKNLSPSNFFLAEFLIRACPLLILGIIKIKTV